MATCGAVKLDIRPYIRHYISTNQHFDSSLLDIWICLPLKYLFRLKLEHWKLCIPVCHLMKCDIVNDINLFRQYITVTIFCHYPIRCHVTIASALEYLIG